MGQTLSEPITEKHSGKGANEKLIYGFSSMQGWRLTMEDAHCTYLQMPNTDKQVALFAVFDGHGGEKIAKYAGENLAQKLVELPHFKEGQLKEALKESYFEIDSSLRNHAQLKDDSSGCTAVSCLITNDEIIVANAGDSRIIISVEGGAVPLSNDHKPTLKTETERILAAGGFVEFGRVNGNLALSRALGDFDFKKSPQLPREAQVVTADPEIITHEITEAVHFAVLACDGIWDCMTNQEVVDFVQTRIAEGKPLEIISEQIIDYCLAPEATLGAVGCDNMSVIIVGFLNGKSMEEWVERCKKFCINTPHQEPSNITTTSTNNNANAGANITAAGGGEADEAKFSY